MKSKLTIPVSMTPAQAVALRTLADALKDSDEARVAARVLSLGLFVLGLDRTGDAGLGQITDAMHGKGSDAAATLYNAITDAGAGAQDEIENTERDRRRQAYAGASTAQVSA